MFTSATHCLSLFVTVWSSLFVFKESNLQGRELRSILVYSRLPKSTVNSLVIEMVANINVGRCIVNQQQNVAVLVFHVRVECVEETARGLSATEWTRKLATKHTLEIWRLSSKPFCSTSSRNRAPFLLSY